MYESETIEILLMSGDEAETLLEGKLGQSDPECRQLAIALDGMLLAITQAAAYIPELFPRCSMQSWRRVMQRGLVSSDEYSSYWARQGSEQLGVADMADLV